MTLRHQTERVQLHVGDCLAMLQSLEPESVDVIVTDPAYSGMNDHMKFGHGRIIGNREDPDLDRWFEEFRDDPETFRQFLHACERVLRPDRHIYVMFDSFSLLSLGHIMREVFNVKNLLVWDKVNMGMGHYYRRRHELILFATKGKRRLASRGAADVWRERRIYGGAYPTQKPVALFARMLAESAEPGMVVLDPFFGSGSAGVAALQADCQFVGCDLSEDALAVARERLEQVERGEADPLEPGKKWEDPAERTATGTRGARRDKKRARRAKR